METTRRYPRTLAQAFPKDYADPIERPPQQMRFSELVALAITVALAVLSLAIKFGVGA